MTTLIFICGAAAVVAGCALIATWLALIVGGTLAMGTSALYARATE